MCWALLCEEWGWGCHKGLIVFAESEKIVPPVVGWVGGMVGGGGKPQAQFQYFSLLFAQASQRG